MRIYVILVVVLLTSMTLAGCNAEETPNTTTAIQETTVQETTTQETTTPTQISDLDEELYQRLSSYCEAQNSTEYPDTIENEILNKFLLWQNEEGCYVVVDPMTTMGSSYNYTRNYSNMVSKKSDIIEIFSYYEYDISDLYDQFLEINEKPSLLTIKSSITEGYYINYHGIFESHLVGLILGYDSEESDYWEFMYTNFPRYSGEVSVSLPAYDPETGYVLIYRGWVGGWLSAGGNLYLLYYKDGNLTEIVSYELWIS